MTLNWSEVDEALLKAMPGQAGWHVKLKQAVLLHEGYQRSELLSHHA